MRFFHLFLVFINFAILHLHAETRNLHVRALSQPALQPDASKLMSLSVTVVGSDLGDDSLALLSVEESSRLKPPLDGDRRVMIDGRIDDIRLSVLDLGKRGEVVLISYATGNRIKFTIYGIDEKLRPIAMLDGYGNSTPTVVSPVVGNDPVICVTNHQPGETQQYFLTLYQARDGRFVATKSYEANSNTAFELKGFVREIPVGQIDRFNTPNQSSAPR